MRVLNKVMAFAGGGAVLGILAGAAMNPAMKPPPAPPWNQVSAPIDPYRIVESGPSDLVSPNWYDGPVDLRLPRYERYGPAVAYADAAPEDVDLSSDDPMRPEATIEPQGIVAATEADAAADDARAVEAEPETAGIVPASEVAPALDGDAAAL